MKTHKFDPQIYYYTFGPNEPALVIDSGDIIVTKTRDARGFDEKLRPLENEHKQTSNTTSIQESNPLVGPIYVKGAEPGDTLAVTVQKIKLNIMLFSYQN